MLLICTTQFSTASAADGVELTLSQQLTAAVAECEATFLGSSEFNCYLDATAAITVAEMQRRHKQYADITDNAVMLLIERMTVELVTVVADHAQTGAIMPIVREFQTRPREHMRTTARRWLQYIDLLLASQLSQLMPSLDYQALWQVCAYADETPGASDAIRRQRMSLYRQTLSHLEESEFAEQINESALNLAHSKINTFSFVSDGWYDCSTVHDLLSTLLQNEFDDSTAMQQLLQLLTDLQFYLAYSGYSNLPNLININTAMVSYRNLTAAVLGLRLLYGDDDALAAMIAAMAEKFKDQFSQRDNTNMADLWSHIAQSAVEQPVQLSQLVTVRQWPQTKLKAKLADLPSGLAALPRPPKPVDEPRRPIDKR